jgi:hypothetical protein
MAYFQTLVFTLAMAIATAFALTYAIHQIKTEDIRWLRVLWYICTIWLIVVFALWFWELCYGIYKGLSLWL